MKIGNNHCTKKIKALRWDIIPKATNTDRGEVKEQSQGIPLRRLRKSRVSRDKTGSQREVGKSQASPESQVKIVF